MTLPTVIGSPVTFEIVPATPGIIFASLKSCTVSKDELSYDVLENRSSGVCRDWATEFEKITSTETWASMERQEFEFLAFKWDTSSVNVSDLVKTKRFQKILRSSNRKSCVVLPAYHLMNQLVPHILTYARSIPMNLLSLLMPD